MTKVEVGVTTDLKGYNLLRRNILKGSSSGRGEFRTIYKKWAVIYRRFLFRRFKKFSKGGGNWRKLKKSTIRNKGHSLILRDTDTLLDSLTPVFSKLPGQYERIIPGGIEVGIRGGKHPKSKVSVGQLASFHQTGAGNYPARKIIVRMGRKGTIGITKALKVGVNKMVEKTKVVK